MDCRLFVKSSLGMAAVVNAFFNSTALQSSVDGIRPRLAPFYKLLVTVPTFRDGILPAELCAFRILVRSFKSSRFRFRRRQILFLLFIYIVGILLFPAVCLCRFELGCRKAPFFTIPDTEIFFFSLVLPFAVFIQRAHCQQNMGVGIMPVRVMDRTVGAHPVQNELLPDKI